MQLTRTNAPAQGEATGRASRWNVWSLLTIGLALLAIALFAIASAHGVFGTASIAFPWGCGGSGFPCVR